VRLAAIHIQKKHCKGVIKRGFGFFGVLHSRHGLDGATDTTILRRLSVKCKHPHNRDRVRQSSVVSTQKRSLLGRQLRLRLPQTIMGVCAVDAVGATQRKRCSGHRRQTVSNI
jgi:hypothetical protein